MDGIPSPCSYSCSFLLYATLLLIADAAFALSLEQMEGGKEKCFVYDRKQQQQRSFIDAMRDLRMRDACVFRCRARM